MVDIVTHLQRVHQYKPHTTAKNSVDDDIKKKTLTHLNHEASTSKQLCQLLRQPAWGRTSSMQLPSLHQFTVVSFAAGAD